MLGRVGVDVRRVDEGHVLEDRSASDHDLRLAVPLRGLTVREVPGQDQWPGGGGADCTGDREVEAGQRVDQGGLPRSGRAGEDDHEGRLRLLKSRYQVVAPGTGYPVPADGDVLVAEHIRSPEVEAFYGLCEPGQRLDEITGCGWHM